MRGDPAQTGLSVSHIFISYSRKDLAFAQKIVTALAEDDLDTWIDWKSIPKGEDWEKEIYHGIEEADAFLFLISPDSVVSEMCNKEIEHAVKNGKRILPIIIRDADPKSIHPEISKRNWIFCRDGQDDFNRAIEETRKTIHTDYEWLKYHTKLQVKALDWERQKDNSQLLRGKELRTAEKQLAEVNNQEDPQPTDLQRYYILASQRNEIRTRQQITFGLAMGLITIMVLSIATWIQRNNALSQTDLAAQSAHQLTISQSQLVFEEYPLLGIRLVMEQLTDSNGIIDDTAVQVLRKQAASGRLSNLGNNIRHTINIPNSAMAIINHRDAPGQIFNPDTGQSILLSGELTDAPVDISFSPKNKFFIVHFAGKMNDQLIFSDLSQFISLSGRDARIDYSPEENFAIATYYDSDTSKYWGELILTHSGIIIPLSALVSKTYYSLDESIAVLDIDGIGEMIFMNSHEKISLSGDVDKVQFSPDNKVFVVTYMDGSTEIRHGKTGKIISKFPSDISSFEFSPDGGFIVLHQYQDNSSSTQLIYSDSGQMAPLPENLYRITFSSDGYLFSVVYQSGQVELRRSATLEIVPVSGTIENIDFIPHQSSYIVYYDNFLGELHQTNSNNVIQLSGVVMDPLGLLFTLLMDQFSPRGRYFTVGYENGIIELRRSDTGEIVVASTNIEKIYFSADDSYFVVSYRNAPAELYSNSFGYITQLNGDIDWIEFSPAGKYLVVHFLNSPLELRRSRNGSIIPIDLPIEEQFYSLDFTYENEFVVVKQIRLSLGRPSPPDGIILTSSGKYVSLSGQFQSADLSPDGSLFVVHYWDKPKELRLSKTGDEFSGSGEIVDVQFSPNGTYFFVTYREGGGELWTSRGGVHKLADFIVTVFLQPIFLNNNYLIAGDSKGWYLFDIYWLQSMDGAAETMPIEQLIRIICDNPMQSPYFMDTDLQPFLGDSEAQSCSSLK
jgi:WD40 repeat protein